jgi:hypothetical protein
MIELTQEGVAPSLRTVRIVLHDASDVATLVSVCVALGRGVKDQVDLAGMPGFTIRDFSAFLLGITSKLRFERVSLTPDARATWLKTRDGWLEAAELVGALTVASHQYLDHGDISVEVERL